MNHTFYSLIIQHMSWNVKRDQLKQKLQDSYRYPEHFDHEEFAMDLFRLQYEHAPVYQSYCQWIGVDPSEVNALQDIPLLPISAFKHHEVKTGYWQDETIFRSSGTTGAARSMHHVRDLSFYLRHSAFLWEYFFGPIKDYRFIGFLPGYVDRGESSLVYMVNHFIESTSGHGSQWVNEGLQPLKTVLSTHETDKKLVLFGVSFALFSFLEAFPDTVFNGIIVETGGMKGLREDMTKEVVIEKLQNGFQNRQVFSEYGMTELFSQAYSSGSFFKPNPYLHVCIKQIQDPLSEEKTGKAGILGCIDLANIDSCSFILTEDSGFKNLDGSFYLSGRLDQADARGCNLLLTDAI